MVQQATTNPDISGESVAVKLPSFFTLVGESIVIYKRLWKPLVLLQFIFTVATFAIGAMASLAVILISATIIPATGSNLVGLATLTLLGVVCLAAVLWFISWTEAATIIVLRDNDSKASIKSALRSALPHVGSFIATYLFIFFAVFFGAIFFIIPGLIFAVWLMFANYIIVFENKNWLAALPVSRDYTRGHFWGLLLLSLLGILSIFFVNSILEVLHSLPMGELISYATSLFLAPIYPIYFFLIFKNLRASKMGSLALDQGQTKSTGKRFVLIIGVAGLLAAFAAIGVAVYYAPQIEERVRQSFSEHNLMNSGQWVPTLPPNIKSQ